MGTRPGEAFTAFIVDSDSPGGHQRKEGACGVWVWVWVWVRV